MSLTKISKKEFLKRLKTKSLEDLRIINLIEKYLLEKRGYIFKMPRPGSSVILLVSGGLDSITCWNILMEEYKLRVFPLSIDKGAERRAREEKSINFFSAFFKKLYPRLFVPPFHLNAALKELQIPIEKAPKILHPQSILENIGVNGDFMSNLSLGSFTLSPILAKLFAEYLYLKQHIHIRSIFCAVTTSDGDPVPEQTFTALRAAMWFLCCSVVDFSWQFSSVCFEKGTGIYFSKTDLVRWASRHNLPLEKTWSCYRNKRYQCGDRCITCKARRKAFRQAKIKDKTRYQNQQSLSKEAIIKTIKKLKNDFLKNY